MPNPKRQSRERSTSTKEEHCQYRIPERPSFGKIKAHTWYVHVLDERQLFAEPRQKTTCPAPQGLPRLAL
jgi:hypothetical protein